MKYGVVLLVCAWNVYAAEALIVLEKNLTFLYTSFSESLSKIPIENVPVLLQSTVSSACGYHALKNGLYYMSYLDGNTGALQKMQDQNIFTDFQSTFVELCNKDQQGEPCKAWEPLDNGSVIRTLNLSVNNKKMSDQFADIQPYFSSDFVTVLSDYPQWNLIDKDYLQKFLRVVDILKSAQNDKHVFLLGVDPNYAAQGLNTHWIAVVVYKQDGNYFYRLLDSLGHDRRADSNVKSFMSLLGQPLQKIREDIAKNISDNFKKDLHGSLQHFQTTGEGALALQKQLARFVQLYLMLQGDDSKFPQWVTKFQDTASSWCSDFLFDGDMYNNLSLDVKQTIKKNKANIKNLKAFIESDEFLERLPALKEE